MCGWLDWSTKVGCSTKLDSVGAEQLVPRTQEMAERCETSWLVRCGFLATKMPSSRLCTVVTVG
jgi:hypothetical protein